MSRSVPAKPQLSSGYITLSSRGGIGPASRRSGLFPGGGGKEAGSSGGNAITMATDSLLNAPVADAAASLCKAETLWVDETHYPHEGIRNWVWTAVQPRLAVFAIYPSRARYVILDFIGERCMTVVMTDRYASYAFIDAERRQVCWAHVLRDFNHIGQRQGLAGKIGRRLLGLGS